MANTTIPSLPLIATPTLNDLTILDQSAVTYRATLAQIQTTFGFSGGVLVPANGGTGVTTFTGTGNNVLSTSPTLVTPVLGAASATSLSFGGSVLNTYTTSNFTPVLNFGGTTTGITYTTQVANYTQIGNVIYFVMTIVLSSKGTATGNATITGLPIASSATYTQVALCAVQNVTFLTTTNVIAILAPSSTSLTLSNQVTGNTFTNYTDTQFANTSTLYISGFYY